MKFFKKNRLNLRINWNYTALAFLFPCLGMMTIMLLGGYEPFGNNYTMLYSDMYHQYYPFFLEFRNALRSGDSLLYSWNVGMGMDYLGLISYYLASPLNLVTVLLPESLMLEYFSLLVPIKLGLAGLFFAIFLKKTFHKNDLSITLFGSFYALCAWALGYQWNIMWLDGFVLLPLVVLGTISLLRDKKFILYTFTLFLSIFANYYVGFFICIFVLLLFICYEICRFQGFARFFADLGRIALFSALAIGMTAVLELPALAALQNTQSSVNTFPDYFSLNMVSSDLTAAAKEAWDLYKSSKEAGDGFLTLAGLWFTALGHSFLPILDGMAQVAGNMNGGLDFTFKEGLPNLYCGVGSMILAFLFLTAKEVKLRDKLCSVGLLVFFMLSFIIRQLDYIWHGFHFTNMIPYRFSFLFSFVLLYMAYRAWLMRDSFKIWQIALAGWLALLIMACSGKWDSFIFLSFNLSFLLLYTGVFIFVLVERKFFTAEDQEQEPDPMVLEKRDQTRRRQATWVLSGLMGFELVLNLVSFGVRFPATTVTNYPKGTVNSEAMFNYLEEREQVSDFFRTEVTHAQTLNDGALNGYNGISTFTSSANVRVTQFMRALGYAAKNTYNRYCFEESSPVSNLFLNLKYMVERDGDVEENRYFDDIVSFGDVHLLQNNAYLPLGFLAESTLSEFEADGNGNRFYIQNDLFKLATGLDVSVWNSLPSDCMRISSDGITINTQVASGYTSYTGGTGTGTLRYTYTADQEGFMCLDMAMSARNNYYVFKNGTRLYNESVVLSQMIAVCDVVPGDEIEVAITCKANESGTVNIRNGILNDEYFRRGYDILAASTLDLTEFSNTRVEGTINCNRDGLMYTSIPYDGNWVAEVDGEEAEIVLVNNAMMALELTEGQHTITFRYENKAFNIGLTVSLLCAAVFVGLIILSKTYGRRKGKYEK